MTAEEIYKRTFPLLYRSHGTRAVQCIYGIVPAGIYGGVFFPGACCAGVVHIHGVVSHKAVKVIQSGKIVGLGHESFGSCPMNAAVRRDIEFGGNGSVGLASAYGKQHVVFRGLPGKIIGGVGEIGNKCGPGHLGHLVGLLGYACPLASVERPGGADVLAGCRAAARNHHHRLLGPFGCIGDGVGSSLNGH